MTLVRVSGSENNFAFLSAPEHFEEISLKPFNQDSP
jgi:hypothetical protein